MAVPQEKQTGFDSAHFYVWVKGLESKVNNLLRQVNVIKDDFVKKNTWLKEEIKTLNEDLLEMKRDQENVLQKMDLVVKELQKTAGKDEVMTLQKYIDLWNPLNFVTQRDLEREVETKISLLRKRKKHK